MQLTPCTALHFSEGLKKIVKIFKLLFKNVSFALLNGWNVTKTIQLSNEDVITVYV
jgi:hypothetical protein